MTASPDDAAASDVPPRAGVGPAAPSSPGPPGRRHPEDPPMSQQHPTTDETVRFRGDAPDGRPPLDGARPAAGPPRVPSSAPAEQPPRSSAPAEQPPQSDGAGENPDPADSATDARAQDDTPPVAAAEPAREADDTRPVTRDWQLG